MIIHGFFSTIKTFNLEKLSIKKKEAGKQLCFLSQPIRRSLCRKNSYQNCLSFCFADTYISGSHLAGGNIPYSRIRKI